MPAANRTPLPIKGEAFRLAFCIRSSATGNPITGGLTGLAAQISKDDGTFAATTGTPTEIGTTGYGYLDLTTTEMNCYGGIIRITASNANALEFSKEFACQSVTSPASGAVPTDIYTMLYWIMARCYNKQVNNGTIVTVYANDSTTPLAAGTFSNTDTTATQNAVRAP